MAIFDEEDYRIHDRLFLQKASTIAVECLQLDITKRPNIRDILSRLQIIAADHSCRSKPSDAGSSSSELNQTTTPVQPITLNELREVTRNFSNGALIGEGSYAKVFFGVLKDGQKSAIKKFNVLLVETDEHFMEQVSFVSRLKHENILQFLGYCLEDSICVLAYEYASRGSLYNVLHGKAAQPGPVLSWAQRVNIAVTAAYGLEFLHEKAQPCVFHSNIKSSNILLFDNDVAKIGDLGVSKQVPDFQYDHSKTHVYTSGFSYDAPESTMFGKFSAKSDVYSFGIVLLELLTGRKAVDSTLPRPQRSLVTWATPRLGEDKVKQCMDPRLQGNYPFKAAAKEAN
ncbi:hypothetical protein QOZ80_1AG0014660 [Eleusine coracana subsp. coracana]|nr:hypothetical protein QOZ80_1AG0014660 [Eleusine coracana subsp. coracana]